MPLSNFLLCESFCSFIFIFIIRAYFKCTFLPYKLQIIKCFIQSNLIIVNIDPTVSNLNKSVPLLKLLTLIKFLHSVIHNVTMKNTVRNFSIENQWSTMSTKSLIRLQLGTFVASSHASSLPLCNSLLLKAKKKKKLRQQNQKLNL